jgi:hypothetical protein
MSFPLRKREICYQLLHGVYSCHFSICSRGQRNWRRALRLIKDRGDPWEKFGLDTLKSERGIRHRCEKLLQPEGQADTGS